MNTNAADVASRWSRNLAGATDKIKQGVMAVQTSPTAKAAQAVQRQVDGVIRAMQSGKTAAALNAVSLGDWQNAMSTKGVARIASGAQAAQPKMQAFMTQFLPFLQTGVQQLQSMPRGDLEQNIARATQMMRYTSGFKYGRS